MKNYGPIEKLWTNYNFEVKEDITGALHRFFSNLSSVDILS